MISALVSRLIILMFGVLHPAYASYKAVRTKHIKEYVKWMMYWIVFAFFTFFESFTDIFLSWLPFYYEVKVVIVLWLLSPATHGSSTLYRKFVHPALERREEEIDKYLNEAKERGYSAVLQLGSKGVNYATNVIMQTALKGGGNLVQTLKRSYSLSDLSEPDVHRTQDEIDQVVAIRPQQRILRPRLHTAVGRSASGTRHSTGMYFTEVDISKGGAGDINYNIRSSEDISSGYSSAEPLSGGLSRTSSMTNASRTRSKGKRPELLREFSNSSNTSVSDFNEDVFIEYEMQPMMDPQMWSYMPGGPYIPHGYVIEERPDAATPIPPNLMDQMVENRADPRLAREECVAAARGDEFPLTLPEMMPPTVKPDKMMPQTIKPDKIMQLKPDMMTQMKSDMMMQMKPEPSVPVQESLPEPIPETLPETKTEIIPPMEVMKSVEEDEDEGEEDSFFDAISLDEETSDERQEVAKEEPSSLDIEEASLLRTPPKDSSDPPTPTKISTKELRETLEEIQDNFRSHFESKDSDTAKPLRPVLHNKGRAPAPPPSSVAATPTPAKSGAPSPSQSGATTPTPSQSATTKPTPPLPPKRSKETEI